MTCGATKCAGLARKTFLYKKDKNLKKEDVKALLDWAHKQPHLPKINELQAIFFLHCCIYSNEASKRVMDDFFTVKTVCKDIFRNRDPLLPQMQMLTEISLVTFLPKKTPEGYIICFLTLTDKDAERFNFSVGIKIFDMIAMLHLYLNGIDEGVQIIINFTNAHLGHVAKLGPLNMKKLLFYIQEAFPFRIKGLHFLNTAPFVDKIVLLMKPFMKKELWDIFHLHPTINELSKFLPVECLPEDLGGSAENLSVLQEKMIRKLIDHKEYFEWEDTLLVDESKRVGKSHTIDYFGMEGTFKKLELD